MRGKVQGRWYEAMGGTGLEVRRGDGNWSSAGYIQRCGRSWDIRVNPYQDEGYTLASCSSLEQAKAEFLRRMGADEVETACAACNGTGAEFPGNPRTEKCEECNGHGVLHTPTAPGPEVAK